MVLVFLFNDRYRCFFYFQPNENLWEKHGWSCLRQCCQSIWYRRTFYLKSSPNYFYPHILAVGYPGKLSALSPLQGCANRNQVRSPILRMLKIMISLCDVSPTKRMHFINYIEQEVKSCRPEFNFLIRSALCRVVVINSYEAVRLVQTVDKNLA